ncbi:MAG: glycoside hydrolase family 9 protein [Chitinispirillaceae bacterium]
MIRLLICISVFLAVQCSSVQKISLRDQPVANNIRINQVGYFPSAPKFCIIADCTATDFHVVDSSGLVVYSGSLASSGKWKHSGEELFVGDFSRFARRGRFQVYVADLGVSAPFEIRDSLYGELFKASLKSFYFQRASMELAPRYAGRWARKAGHPDTSCILHSSTGKSGRRSAPGGWYDAGDFGKYVTPAGITVATMLSLHERLPRVAGDDFTNIPESGNGQSDLLDEARYQIDWMRSMQDDDGGVFFKLSGLSWPGIIMPHEDTLTRYIIGKSTTSTLSFAGVMAQTARIYRDIDSAYAEDCLRRAHRAWEWARKNPTVAEPKEQGGSGGYGVEQHGWMDTTCAGAQYLKEGPAVYEDEFFWAAAELYISSGRSRYETYIKETLPEMNFTDVPAWWDLQGMAYYSLLTTDNNLEKQLKDTVLNRVLSAAEAHLQTLQNSPYRIPYECFFWGSNASFLNTAILFSYAHTLTGDPKYYDAILETVDYVLGKNATGYCFVTGFGNRYPRAIHHRQCGADSIDEPIPGFVVGGPNKIKQDDKQKVSWGAEYPHREPARSFVDDQKSYASNETALNWTAPLVHIMGYLVATR